jgi:CheY-like chemotaxis protein
MDERPKVVAVINSSPDTVDLLRFVFEHAGFVVVSAFTWEMRDSQVDVEAFMRQHRPHVVVYDISPPYDENWRLFQHFCTLPALQGIAFVITTTNVKHVKAVAGPGHELHEVIGKPYDLDLIVKAVQERLAGR